MANEIKMALMTTIPIFKKRLFTGAADGGGWVFGGGGESEVDTAWGFSDGVWRGGNRILRCRYCKP